MGMVKIKIKDFILGSKVKLFDSLLDLARKNKEHA